MTSLATSLGNQSYFYRMDMIPKAPAMVLWFEYDLSPGKYLSEFDS